MDEKKTSTSEIPTALPGFEAENAREKLLFETSDDLRETDEEEIEDEKDVAKPKKRRWQILRTFAGFAVFVGLLIVAISWFFGMGLFSGQKPQPVSRGTSKDVPTSPVTEDEKLKIALSMVAAKVPATSGTPVTPPTLGEDGPDSDDRVATTEIPGSISSTSSDQIKAASVNDKVQYPSLVADQGLNPKVDSSETKVTETLQSTKRTSLNVRNDAADDARGRSLFFGIERKTVKTETSRNIAESNVDEKVQPVATEVRSIPFGSLLPVRLVGSIYTFRNSGGFVRMELTRPVEGKGYFYPAGTMLVGNVRGGEYVRAFVTIVGLIDPVSGELVKFGGELLGRDGGSGIEGRRRKLTSQWSRFFSGLRDTAASVLGSVGAVRSGGTVILSEPLKKGSESMAEVLSGAILGNGKDNDTFIEVSAGANGYVLITGLPESSSSVRKKPGMEASNE